MFHLTLNGYKNIDTIYYSEGEYFKICRHPETMEQVRDFVSKLENF